MKSKLSIIISLLFLSFAFFGCSVGIEENAEVYEKNGGEGSTVLHGNISNYDSLKNSSTRTIIASDYQYSFDYYIYGYTSTGLVKTAEKVAIGADGTFSVTISPYYWTLILFAVKSGATVPSTYSIHDIRTNSILAGYATADLTNYKGNVNFRLVPDNLETNGVTQFSVCLSNDNGATNWSLPIDADNRVTYRAEAELQNLLTGEIINYEDDSKSSTFVSPLTFGVNSTASFGGGKSIKPGNYNFVIRFKDGNGNVKGVWSDIISVLPGREIIQTVYVPNVIGKKPDKPSYFYSAYIKNSEDSLGREGYYKAIFSWSNNAVNETHYEIQLADIYGRTISWTGSDAEWNSVSARITSYDKSFESVSERVSGSLLANNTEIILYLQLGVQYQARIRSVNHTGTSEWVNVVIPKTGITTSEGTVSYFTDESGANPAMTINRGRIVYNTNGGAYANAYGQSTGLPKIQYFVQTNPVPESTIAVPYWDGGDLARGGDVFRYWSSNLNNLSSTHVYDKNGAATGYTSSLNITLYADYETSSSSVVPEKFLAKWMNYSTDNVSPAVEITGSATSTKAAITVSKATDARVNLECLVPVGDISVNYETYSLKIYDSTGTELSGLAQSKTAQNIGTRTSFNSISLASLSSELYTIQIKASRTSSSIIERTVEIIMIVND